MKKKWALTSVLNNQTKVNMKHYTIKMDIIQIKLYSIEIL